MAPKTTTFELKNIKDVSLLKCEADNVNFKVISTEKPDMFLLSLTPSESVVKEKSFKMFYDGKMMAGPGFNFEKPATVSHNQDQSVLSIDGVKDHDKIELKTKHALNYDIHSDAENANTYHVMYRNPQDLKNEIHVYYNGELLTKNPIEIGKVERIVPGTVIMSNFEDKEEDKKDEE